MSKREIRRKHADYEMAVVPELDALADDRRVPAKNSTPKCVREHYDERRSQPIITWPDEPPDRGFRSQQLKQVAGGRPSLGYHLLAIDREGRDRIHLIACRT